MTKPTWIKQLVRSLVKGHKLMDPSAWAPPNPFLLDPLFEDLWLEKILELKRRVEARKISYQKIAESLSGPACIRKEFRYALWGGKLRGLPTEKILETITFYKNILLTKASPDPFCLHSAFWHSPQELKEVTNNSQWAKATTEAKTVIGKISANCPPLAWGLLTDFFYHRAYELYGLYQSKGHDIVMIRQYGPFQMPEIWKHTAKYPFNQIIIKCIYDNLRGDFDYINHLTTPDNIREKLKYYCVKVDGNVLNNIQQLNNLNDKIIKLVMEADNYLKTLGQEGLKLLTVNAKYYALKEVFALVNMDWRPDSAVLKRFRNKPLLKIPFKKFNSPKDLKNFWQEMFDLTTPLSRPEFLSAQKQLTKKIYD